VIREEALICEGKLIREGGADLRKEAALRRNADARRVSSRGGCRAAEGLIREGLISEGADLRRDAAVGETGSEVMCGSVLPAFAQAKKKERMERCGV
jgi:hypothetical protein